MAQNKEQIFLDLKIQGTQELVQLRTEIIKYEKSLKKLKAETKDTRATESQIKGLSALETKLKSTRKEYNKIQKEILSTNKVQKKSSRFTMKMATAFGAANIATSLFMGSMRALKKAIKDGIVTFKDFEFQMAKVKAISGANDKEFKKLKDSAQELGRTTFFTASQVGELQLNLSKLGFRPEEILQSQEAILQLSTAMGEDLGRTATVVAASLRGFGESTEETGRFADAMAAAFSNSALDIEKFQTSMSKVSAIAAMAGFSFEETTGLLALLTNSGMEASIAGTSLRNILLHLQDPTSDLSQRLGRTVHSGEDLIVALKELSDSGINVAGVMEIVDRRQVQAMNSFIAGADTLTEFNKILNASSGSAEDMADIMENTLGGALLKLKSAYEGLTLAFLDGSGAMQSAVEFLATTLNSLADRFTSVDTRAERFVTTTIKDLKKEFKELSKSEEDFEGTLSGMMAHRRGRMEQRLQDNKEDLKQFEEDNKFLIAIENRKALATVEAHKREIETQELAVQKMAEAINTQIAKEKEAADEEERLKNQQAEAASKLSGQLEKLQERQKELVDIGEHLTEHGKAELIQTNQQILAIQKQIKALKELGVEEKKEKKELTDSQLADIELNQILNNEKLRFAEGEIKTKKMLNESLLQLTIEHMEKTLATATLNADERLKLESKLADQKAKLRENDLAATAESEKAKTELIKANIDNAMAIGSSLTQIGQLIGENSAAAKAGIAITKAASIASAINGIIDTKRAIAKQAAGGDPFSAFARMAMMAAAVAPLLTSLIALKGEAGGGGSSLVETEGTFAKGGLTNGGMFEGASHANGGVKFAVGGRIMEAEGGEAIINKRSTARFRPILSAINSYNGNGVKFADGGLINSGEKFAMGGELRSIQQMVSGGGSSKVVMVESDVTKTQGRVSSLEAQASF